ncbi:MAG: class I SAM-dependent methyltransferase [Promethearchaeota archaeon]
MDSQAIPKCFYCKIIKNYESTYPVRLGSFSVDDTAFRCALHSQFQCSLCKKFHHFSWLYWCENKQELICGDCNKPVLHPITFWNTTYAYSFQCSSCNEPHFDLYYSEFQGKHPWQLDMGKYTHSVEFGILDLDKWKPEKVRSGKKITVDEALKIPNGVLSKRKKMSSRVGSVKFHSPLLDQATISQTDVRAQWEQTSKQWIDLVNHTSQDDIGDINRQLIIDPAMWKLIGEVNNLSVLDAGCGNGYFSRALALRGALVTGVDQSKVLIDYCKNKEKQQQLGIDYHTWSLEDLRRIDDNQFDLIISNIVFVDVLHYKQAFKELARVLKLEGRFIWSNLHPVFARISNLFYRLPFDTPRNEERLYVMIDRYFDSGGTLISWGSMEPIWQFDRTLSEYSAALKGAGFLIREIVEPKPDNEVIKNHPRLLAFDTDRIPFFIIFECIKQK